MPPRENRKRPLRFSEEDDDDDQRRALSRGDNFGMSNSAVQDEQPNTTYAGEQDDDADPDDYDGQSNEDISQGGTPRGGTQSTPLQTNIPPPATSDHSHPASEHHRHCGCTKANIPTRSSTRNYRFGTGMAGKH